MKNPEFPARNPRRIRYRCNFRLPSAEADFVCALASLCKMDPDAVLCALIRKFARENHGFSLDVWEKAIADHRGPWEKEPP